MKNFFTMLYPSKCMVCGEIGEYLLCQACENKLEKDYENRENTPPPSVSDVISLFRYEGLLRKLVLGYKFHGKNSYGAAFARLLLQRVLMQKDWHIDGICYVPMGPLKNRDRGYNQTKIMASYLAKHLDKPLLGCVKKRPFVKKQSALTEKERKENLNHAFYLTPRAETVLTGKVILLVDDVLTTGSTLAAMASVLKSGGATRVYCITIAKTGRKLKAKV